MTSVPITTLEEALDYLAPKHCGSCGTRLDPPGTPCGGCGTLPGRTRPELARQLLAEPDSIARTEGERLDAEAAVEVKRLRAEGAQRVAEAERLFREADSVNYRAVLRRRRDAAEGGLQAAVGVRKQLAAEFGQAAADEDAARAPLAEAFDCHEKAKTAEEQARRMCCGPAAETEALVRLDAAVKVLGRHRDKTQEVVRARQVAEAALEVAEQNVAECEAERDAAAAALTRCAPVPLSTETVRAAAAPLLRIAAGQDVRGQVLTGVERATAAVYGQAAETLALMDYHAAMASLERARLAEEERTANPPHLQQVGDGMLSAAWAIPPKGPDSVPGAVVTPAPVLSQQPAGFSGPQPGFPVRPIA